MADHSENKSAAEIQREIELQRHRVEDTIDQLQERLSPGQIVDELMSYTKSGGADFAASLGKVAMRNPLPVALLGVSLLWLIARPGGSSDGKHSEHARDREWDSRLASNGGRNYAGASSYGSTYAGSEYDSTYSPYDEDDVEYPTTTVQGNLQRLGSVTDESGNRYSEFVDDAGKKFRALSDAAGNRAGHFMDEAGNKFRGFTDATGSGITQIRDEAGNLLHEASGWASHTWAAAGRRLQDAGHIVRSGMGGIRSGVSGLASGIGGLRSGVGNLTGKAGHLSGRATEMGGQIGGQVQQQAGQMARTAQHLLYEQPLVGAALAFAVGAAIGSALPRTEQEDHLLGEVSDNLKKEAGNRASELYEKGKEQVGQIYETAQEKAARLYDQAKDTLETAKDAIAPATGSSGQGQSAPSSY